MSAPNYDSYFDPPDDDWGRCPHCGTSQEDASLFGSVYVCGECDGEYSDEDAHPDPREMRDEMRMSEAEL